MEFTHFSRAMLKCDRSDYVAIYLRIYLHSFQASQTKDELNRFALELGGTSFGPEPVVPMNKDEFGGQ